MLKLPFVFDSAAEKDTEEIGRAFSSQLAPGNVVGFTGQLGAGKTCMIRGICAGLGIKELINSPTFALQKIYHASNATVNHFDAYRISSESEAIETGILDFFNQDCISLIEWAERIESLFKEGTFWVSIDYAGGTGRRIKIEKRH